MASQADRIKTLTEALHSALRQRQIENLEKVLNRYKICAKMDKEIYGTDIEAMRKQIKDFEIHVNKLESVLIAKNQEIIRLKSRGGIQQ